MKFTAGHIVALVAAGLAFLAFDRFSTREDRWRQRLADEAARVRTEDSVAYDALRLRFVKDSVQRDSLLAAADSEEANHIRLAQENGRLRVRLAQAPTLPDTVKALVAIVANQDSVIASDSVQKGQLRATIGIQAGTIVDLTNSLADTRRRLADLVAVAERPPKEFKLLGLTLSLKPVIGAGFAVSPQGKATAGVILGVSVLRG